MSQVGEIVDELLVHAPEAEIVALFKEEANLVTVSLRSKTHEANVAEIAGGFGGGGHVQAAGAKFTGIALQEVMTKVLSALFEYQKKRLKLLEEGIKKPKITQVLEGYTSMPEPKPSLEKRMRDSSTPPREAAGSVGMTEEDDIHHKAKAAIMAEQSQSNGTPFAPSKLMKPDDRPKPEKRFTDELPGYIKTGSAPKPPQAPMTPPLPQKPSKLPDSDEGVKVFFSPPKPPSPPNELNEPKSPHDPSPPKDPFSLGDDGMTDIERALGNL